MKTIPNPTAVRTPQPLVVAGLAVLTLQLLREVGLPMPSITTVMQVLGIERQRAYEMAEHIREATAHLPRPVGRPPGPSASEDSSDDRYAVCAAVRRFLEEHPGSHVAHRQRDGYSPKFRRFILRLRQRGAAARSLSLGVFAGAVGVPLETLRDWIAGRRSPRPGSESDTGNDKLPVYPDGVIDQIVTLWRQNRGLKLVDFARILLEQHRICVPVSALLEILRLSGDRSRAQPRKPKPDPEAVRGALERFFPGAQWVADGKHITVRVGEQTFSFNWELTVDAFTGAHVGFDVRDAEDSASVVAALEHGETTTGANPLALLVDNRPSNLTDEVVDALDEQGVFAMRSTPFRAENKADVEGAFGLFAQTMPPLDLPAPDDLRAFARRVVMLALFAYCAGRNHVPRAGLRQGASAANTYLDYVPTDEERQQALDRLQEIARRIQQRRDVDAERDDPVCRRMLGRLFAEIGVDDPDGHMARSVARHGLGVVAEAIAILRARLEGEKSIEFPDRYAPEADALPGCATPRCGTRPSPSGPAVCHPGGSVSTISGRVRWGTRTPRGGACVPRHRRLNFCFVARVPLEAYRRRGAGFQPLANPGTAVERASRAFGGRPNPGRFPGTSRWTAPLPKPSAHRES